MKTESSGAHSNETYTLGGRAVMKGGLKRGFWNIVEFVL